MKFDFTNQFGETLSGRLELPSGQTRAIALFAHCFTCSKDIIAPRTIAQALNQQNIGVLRFDFTGLGNSEGDFANTNFSSNVQDLISACEQLRQKFQLPQVLIGHSLGGAAVLKAATKLQHIKAVITIGAPSDVKHVAHLFSDSINEIQQRGEAEVSLVGRKFTIKKQFIDDINETQVLEGIKHFKKPLLVMHAPLDDTVSIDHAANIFQAAQHPKSFVSLDKAGHLLMDKADASYAGKVIGAWLDHYLPQATPAPIAVENGHILVVQRPGAKFTQDVYSSKHHLVADEPAELKGSDLGMNPYEMLLASLGSCTAMTMKMYADHKKIPIESIQVDLKHEKKYFDDCKTCDEGQPKKIDHIHKKIKISGPICTQQRQRLYEISEKCPVNRTLNTEIKIDSELER